MRISPKLLLLALIPAFLFSVRAQTPVPSPNRANPSGKPTATPYPTPPPTPTPAPPAPPAQNVLAGFEKSRPVASIWNGVDASGALIGNVEALPVLALNGVVSPATMPVSVSVADLNGDGLPDIAVMDVLGYLRIYFNSGTKTVPKFTVGELSTIFLTRTSASDPALPLPLKDVEWWVANTIRDYARRGPKIFLTNRMGSVKNDLIIGNYSGEILFVPNTGSASLPEFKQPLDVAKAVIPTAKDVREKWGNVFSPAVWDWNKDGKSDLLVGEGSYSANSIHLLINKGSNERPVFDENNRTSLAFGMGLEQLNPCVVDYNGDGFPDLLVTERSGKVAVYLNNGKPWKAGDTLAFDSFIKAGVAYAPNGPDAKPDPMTDVKAPGLLTLGGISTIAAADLNGDGLFDLVFGKSNGRIAVALNTGTKEQPKFSAPVEIISETKAPMVNAPANWICDVGLTRGNFYAYASAVGDVEDPEAKPPTGPHCLKIGYQPSPNKVMPPPKTYSPPAPGWDRKLAHTGWIQQTFGSPANLFRLQYPDNPGQINKFALKTKTPYTFSLRMKGNGVSDATITFNYHVRKYLSESKQIHGDRGTVVLQENYREEWQHEIIKFTPGATWGEVKKQFSLKFKDKDLDDVKQVEPGHWFLTISFDLAPAVGTLYLDDISLMEK